MTIFVHQVVWGVHRSGSTAAVDPLVYLSLPPSKQRWVTTAILLHSPTLPLDSVSFSNDLTTADSTATEDSSLSPHWLVCGDRKGSLHVYQIILSTKSREVTMSRAVYSTTSIPLYHLSQYVQPMQSLRGIHGSNGVTHIAVNEGHLVTCGRDGHCRSFSLHPHTGLMELTKFKVPVHHSSFAYKYISDLVLDFCV